MNSYNFPVNFDASAKVFKNLSARVTVPVADLDTANTFLREELMVYLGPDDGNCVNGCKYVWLALQELERSGPPGYSALPSGQADKKSTGSDIPPAYDHLPVTSGSGSGPGPASMLITADMTEASSWAPPNMPEDPKAPTIVAKQIETFQLMTQHLTPMQIGELAVLMHGHCRDKNNEDLMHFYWNILFRVQLAEANDSLAEEGRHVTSGFAQTQTWLTTVMTQINGRIPEKAMAVWCDGLAACARVESLGLAFKDMLNVILNTDRRKVFFPGNTGKKQVNALMLFLILSDADNVLQLVKSLRTYESTELGRQPNRLAEMLQSLDTKGSNSVLDPSVHAILIQIAGVMDRYEHVNIHTRRLGAIAWAPLKAGKAVGKYGGLFIVGATIKIAKAIFYAVMFIPAAVVGVLILREF